MSWIITPLTTTSGLSIASWASFSNLFESIDFVDGEFSLPNGLFVVDFFFICFLVSGSGLEPVLPLFDSWHVGLAMLALVLAHRKEQYPCFLPKMVVILSLSSYLVLL